MDEVNYVNTKFFPEVISGGITPMVRLRTIGGVDDTGSGSLLRQLLWSNKHLLFDKLSGKATLDMSPLANLETCQPTTFVEAARE